jgi:putative PIN family toxin of toxin-antitoxin system
MRFVLNTNMMVAALRSPAGASAELLRRLRLKEGTLLLSAPLLLEYEAVCTRPEQLHAFGLSVMEVEAVLDVVVSIATEVEINFLWRPRLRDAADEMVLETAINGMAGAIVTFNIRDFKSVPQEFGISLFGPKSALEALSK